LEGFLSSHSIKTKTNKMVIPLGVNHGDFYRSAKSKGVKINSRYKGVSLHKTNCNTDLVWRCNITINKKTQHFFFPFTEKGEREAHEKYLQLKTQNK
jgi:hypothetical protein